MIGVSRHVNSYWYSNGTTLITTMVQCQSVVVLSVIYV